MMAFGITMGLRWPHDVMKVVGTRWELLAPRGHAGRGVTPVFAWPCALGSRIKSGTTERGDGRLTGLRRALWSAQLDGGAVGEDLGGCVCYGGGGVPHGDHGVRAECFRL